MRALALTLILSSAALSGCSHLSKSNFPDFKLDDAVFEPAIIQPEEVESTDTPAKPETCLLYTSPSPRDQRGSRMPSSA